MCDWNVSEVACLLPVSVVVEVSCGMDGVHQTNDSNPPLSSFSATRASLFKTIGSCWATSGSTRDRQWPPSPRTALGPRLMAKRWSWALWSSHWSKTFSWSKCLDHRSPGSPWPEARWSWVWSPGEQPSLHSSRFLNIAKSSKKSCY